MDWMKLTMCAIVLAGAVTPAASAQSGASRHFIEDALMGDNSEMMLGKLAAERGANPEVRAYGQTLYDDHARARAQAIPLARQAGLQVTDKPMPEAAQERRKLETLHGQAFDREFTSYMVKDHKKDISEFEREARKGGPTADLAKQTLPVLRKHLATAQHLSHS
jgi:putative membrane protein